MNNDFQLALWAPPRSQRQRRPNSATTETPKGKLTTAEVIKLTGANYRQIDYWCRRGMVDGQPSGSATGSGFRRSWTLDDVHRIRLLRVAAMIRNGSLADILNALDTLGVLDPIEKRLTELELPK